MLTQACINAIGLPARTVWDNLVPRLPLRLLRVSPNDRLTPRAAASRAYGNGYCSGFPPDSLIPASALGRHEVMVLFGSEIIYWTDTFVKRLAHFSIACNETAQKSTSFVFVETRRFLSGRGRKIRITQMICYARLFDAETSHIVYIPATLSVYSCPVILCDFTLVRENIRENFCVPQGRNLIAHT